jgi:hypothetical protein
MPGTLSQRLPAAGCHHAHSPVPPCQQWPQIKLRMRLCSTAALAASTRCLLSMPWWPNCLHQAPLPASPPAAHSAVSYSRLLANRTSQQLNQNLLQRGTHALQRVSERGASPRRPAPQLQQAHPAHKAPCHVISRPRGMYHGRRAAPTMLNKHSRHAAERTRHLYGVTADLAQWPPLDLPVKPQGTAAPPAPA